jgi:hypothetical protein
MKAVLSILFLVVGFSLHAQQPVSLELSNATFSTFIEAIENQSPVHVYYDQRQIDTIRVTVSVRNVPIREVLLQVLGDPEWHVVQDSKNNFFLSWRRTILTSLPSGLISGMTTEDSEADLSAYGRKKSGDQQPEKVVVLGKPTRRLGGEATITGVVRDALTGEPLSGVAVFQQEPLVGTTTDALGEYAIRLGKGKRILLVQSVGMKTARRTVMLYEDGRMDVELEEEVTALKDVVVNAARDQAVQGVQMGKEKLDIKSMKQLPMALGETDVLKSALALPGVQSVGEGAGGLNVRGGASNQNLVLFNGATIYNPSHLFGFFSTFNPDVVKDLELIKSGLEADRGGRLSSVFDVSSREGNLKKFTATGGLSPITGRITLEGPIIKEKTSLLVGGRSSYSDWILKRLDSEEFNGSTANFYDANMHLSHKVDDNDQLSVSAYSSRDGFRLNSDTTYRYGDRNASVNWLHRFKNGNFSEVIAAFSRYDFSISSKENPVNAFRFRYAIEHGQLRSGLSWILNSRHTLSAGIQSDYYRLNPGVFEGIGGTSVVEKDFQQQETALEMAAYVGDNFEVSNKLSVYAGIRFSWYGLLGPKDVIQYKPNAPVETSSIIDTLSYASGLIQTYQGIEPRLNLRYLLNPQTSIKFSLGRTRQYLQMLSNNTAIAPTDLWKLSDSYIRPQIADQISLGWFKNAGAAFEISVEGYYKFLKTATDFQNGAVLFRNDHIETEVLNAQGKAYGVEFLVRRSTTRLSGWLSYTWSRSFLRTTGSDFVEKVNNNTWYPSNFDKPHSVNFVSNYKFNRRINVSWNLTYSTGRPITLPVARYTLDGGGRLEYSDRNAYRIPDYFRSDLAINFEGNHRIRKLAHSSWSLSIYNLTGRRNAYSVFFRTEGSEIKGYKLSIFGQAIPTLTWNFKL